VRVLIIGGTGFIGRPLARQLGEQGHTVAVFSRGHRPGLENVVCIRGDRNRLGDHAQDIRAFAPEVVVDMVLSSGAQARALIETVSGVARRVVAASSGDVYRAAGILHGTEPGPLQSMPLTEESETRTRLNVYPEEILLALRQTFEWLDADYDKVPVEREILAAAGLERAVVRLPMVYGPGDPLHRLFPLIKRMDDGRSFILLPDDLAGWRSPRGYVDNVAAALALSATAEQLPSAIYNVAEPEAWSELEWARKVAAAAGWSGEIRVLPRDHLPKHMLMPGNFAQHWVMSSNLIRSQLGYKERVNEAAAIDGAIAWERAHPPAQGAVQFDYAAEDQAAAQRRSA
jgi:nucleoside-diphosphate-sugar epimerase